MSSMMICFIGQQQAPNLLPILAYRPEAVVLIHTTTTTRVADNLCKVIADQALMGFACQSRMEQVEPYDISSGKAKLAAVLNDFAGSRVILNLTGGTKIMSHTGYEFARSLKDALLTYLESERNCTFCYEYMLDADGMMRPLEA